VKLCVSRGSKDRRPSVPEPLSYSKAGVGPAALAGLVLPALSRWRDRGAVASVRRRVEVVERARLGDWGPRGGKVERGQNRDDDFGVGDERDDAEASATRTSQSIDVVDALEQSARAGGQREGRLRLALVLRVWPAELESRSS